MRRIVMALTLATLPLVSGAAAGPAATAAVAAEPARDAVRPADLSARKKARRYHRHVDRSFGSAYGYDAYPRQGYYRGIRPGWGYGPDPGDRAWPPFHFRPYY